MPVIDLINLGTIPARTMVSIVDGLLRLDCY